MKGRIKREVGRPVSRALPAVLGLIDAAGQSLVEGIVGLWLGVALAALVAWSASAQGERILAGAAIFGAPDRLCQPRIGGGPYFDGDSVVLANGTVLVCDGISGNWESEAARADRRAALAGAAPMLE